jgi:2-hydroxychromene-2-carboxylate isomerase
MTTIDYFMTLNSPWAYLGSRRLIEIAGAKGAKIDIKPTKFGPVFEVTGGLPLPKRAPARRAYRLMELDRWRKFRNRPLVLEPKFFPANEALGTRMILRAKLAGFDAVRLSSEFGCAIWELEQDISQPEVLAAAAVRAGIDTGKLASAPTDAELDAMNDAFTQEAISRGVFGAPTYMLPSGEFFWGQDRLEFLERAL